MRLWMGDQSTLPADPQRWLALLEGVLRTLPTERDRLGLRDAAQPHDRGDGLALGARGVVVKNLL